MTALVLGFGAFGGIADNPSARLALALEGRTIGLGRHLVLGLEMPVSYERSYAFTLDAVRRTAPALVLGIGVASARTCAMVERTGRNRASQNLPDVDGVCLADHGTGTLLHHCDIAEELARALEFPVSEDAGEYVCNSWLFRALRAKLPAAFVHLPLTGVDNDAFAAGLGRYLDSRSPPPG